MGRLSRAAGVVFAGLLVSSVVGVSAMAFGRALSAALALASSPSLQALTDLLLALLAMWVCGVILLGLVYTFAYPEEDYDEDYDE
ncbi:MAG: hypothetical protein LM580_03260 [Thermofilum sp.]|nr:hypothetical protein [Thermofilum sp.]